MWWVNSILLHSSQATETIGQADHFGRSKIQSTVMKSSEALYQLSSSPTHTDHATHSWYLGLTVSCGISCHTPLLLPLPSLTLPPATPNPSQCLTQQWLSTGIRVVSITAQRFEAVACGKMESVTDSCEYAGHVRMQQSACGAHRVSRHIGEVQRKHHAPSACVVTTGHTTTVTHAVSILECS